MPVDSSSRVTPELAPVGVMSREGWVRNALGGREQALSDQADPLQRGRKDIEKPFETR